MAINFDTGATDRLRSGDNTNPAFNTTMSPDGTVVVRIRTNWAYNDGVGHLAFSYGGQQGGFPSLGNAMMLKWTDNNFYIGFFNPGSDQRMSLSASGLITSGSWATWLWAYHQNVSAGRHQEFFIDGTQVGTDPNQVTGVPNFDLFGDANDRTYVGNGGSPDVTSLAFRGDVCEIARWSRYLDAVEISALGLGFTPLSMPRGLLEYRILANLTHTGSVGTTTEGPSMSTTDGSPSNSTSHPRVFGPS